MMPATVPAVPGTAPVPAPVVAVVVYQDEGIPAALLFLAYIFGGKPLEILLAEGLGDCHVFVESLIVDAVLEALRCAVLA